jgi:hypothetical protein
MRMLRAMAHPTDCFASALTAEVLMIVSSPGLSNMQLIPRRLRFLAHACG